MCLQPVIPIQIASLPVSREAGWGHTVDGCARWEAISGADLQPFAITEPSSYPPLRKDVLLEGSLSLEVADGAVGFQPVPCCLYRQISGSCPQAAT